MLCLMSHAGSRKENALLLAPDKVSLSYSYRAVWQSDNLLPSTSGDLETRFAGTHLVCLSLQSPGEASYSLTEGTFQNGRSRCNPCKSLRPPPLNTVVLGQSHMYRIIGFLSQEIGLDILSLVVFS